MVESVGSKEAILELLYRSYKVLTQRLLIYSGPPIWCRHFSLIAEETYVHCPYRSTENSYMPNGHSTSRPAKIKNHTGKTVSGRGLKIPLMDDR